MILEMITYKYIQSNIYVFLYYSHTIVFWLSLPQCIYSNFTRNVTVNSFTLLSLLNVFQNNNFECNVLANREYSYYLKPGHDMDKFLRFFWPRNIVWNNTVDGLVNSFLNDATPKLHN